MELTQELFQVLGSDYSQSNVKKALEHMDHLLYEEEEYFQLGKEAGEEELSALFDLMQEFMEYIQAGNYTHLKKYLCVYR
ncbi:MAG: hypothetical protein Q4D16_10865 [Eubacteriales bacterium]|nr:hypothetical protein [Eubacteriales bacterium]